MKLPVLIALVLPVTTASVLDRVRRIDTEECLNEQMDNNVTDSRFEGIVGPRGAPCIEHRDEDPVLTHPCGKKLTFSCYGVYAAQNWFKTQEGCWVYSRDLSRANGPGVLTQRCIFIPAAPDYGMEPPYIPNWPPWNGGT